jgi:hypothetical protein
VSSPLEGRIRVLAREETASLQQQITDLHEHLHLAVTSAQRLENRIAALEEAAGLTEEQTTARRGRRKTADQ